MDEHFECFLEEFGKPINKVTVPISSVERYREKLPKQLLNYWQEHGWTGYADGLFWTVNPQEYEPVLEAWIGDTPYMEQDSYHIIARSAFGGLYFWGEKTGYSLKIFAPGAYAMPQARQKSDLDQQIRAFFAYGDKVENDFDNLFVPALKKLGRLRPDEMYGFVPALALGGPATLDHLQKVKAVEHLVFLAQLSDLTVINGPSV